MKAMATISTMILAAGMAAGQAKPAQKPAAPASQSPATKMTTTAAKPAAAPAKTMAAKPAAKLGAASMSAPAKQAKPAATQPKDAAATTDFGKGKRDPFVSPVVVRAGDTGAMGCSTGKRCLVIEQLTLEGVVKTTNGWIAVIGNPAKKVYYLRENDALFDGFVKRITGDSVVFQQNVVDTIGKASQREVVKRIAPSA